MREEESVKEIFSKTDTFSPFTAFTVRQLRRRITMKAKKLARQTQLAEVRKTREIEPDFILENSPFSRSKLQTIYRANYYIRCHMQCILYIYLYYPELCVRKESRTCRVICIPMTTTTSPDGTTIKEPSNGSTWRFGRHLEVGRSVDWLVLPSVTPLLRSRSFCRKCLLAKMDIAVRKIHEVLSPLLLLQPSLPPPRPMIWVEN